MPQPFQAVGPPSTKAPVRNHLELPGPFWMKAFGFGERTLRWRSRPGEKGGESAERDYLMITPTCGHLPRTVTRDSSTKSPNTVLSIETRLQESLAKGAADRTLRARHLSSVRKCHGLDRQAMECDRILPSSHRSLQLAVARETRHNREEPSSNMNTPQKP